jgi:hypothetical protein
MTTTDAIRQRIDLIGTACTTAADALDGAALDLGEGRLAALFQEIDGLAGRLALVCDRLAGRQSRCHRPAGYTNGTDSLGHSGESVDPPIL